MFVIADLNVRFDQDLDRARRMFDRVRLAADASGVEVIAKGEVLWDPGIARDCDYLERWWTRGPFGDYTMHEERFRDVIARKCNPLEAHRKLFGELVDAGVPLMVSVYDAEGVQLAAELGAHIKVASSNVNHLPLVDAIHREDGGMSVFVDTGRSTLAEVDTVLRRLARAEQWGLYVAHSPDGHPAAPMDHHLRSITTLQHCFDDLVNGVGFATHATHDAPLYMALALGAKYVEVGVTDEPQASDQDVCMAVELDRLGRLCTHLRQAADMLGMGWRDDPAEYMPARLASSPRMGAVAAQTLTVGTPLDPLDGRAVRYAFPQAPGQLLPEHVDLWAQRPVMRNVAAGEPILWNDLVGEE